MDLLMAAKEYGDSMRIPAPQLFSNKPDALRPKQKALECVLWAVNTCISPRDGGQDALPRQVLHRWLDSEAHAKLHSGVFCPCDFLSELKRNNKVEKTGMCRFGDIIHFFQKHARGLTFRKVKNPRNVVPLKNYQVIHTDRVSMSFALFFLRNLTVVK
jgi:hypothetical protein